MDFNQIQELVKLVSRSKVSEFILKEGDFKIIIRNQSTHAAGAETAHPQVILPIVPQVTAVQPQAPTTPEVVPSVTFEKPVNPAADSKLVAIKSPMVGTFYRSASPDKPPFVKVGDVISAGSPVCVIEAMKLFNEIESDIKGKIVKVLVEDATPVEYDQPLFLVDPS